MDVAATYHAIIREVMKNVAAEFNAEHVNHAVLLELEKSWEDKLMDSGVLNSPSNLEDLGDRLKADSSNCKDTGSTRHSLLGQGINEGSSKKRKRHDNDPAQVQVDSSVLSSDSENDNSEAEPVTSHLVLTQFENVGRTKNKWKCNFKDGIMLLNGSEYMFGKGNAEFLW